MRVQAPIENCAVVLVGHGSRDPDSTRAFDELVVRYRLHQPTWIIYKAFIELEPPEVRTTLAELALRYQRLTVVPMFLFASGHIKNDVPLIIDEFKQRFPQTQIAVTNVVGVEVKMIDILNDRAAACLGLVPSQESQKQTGVIVVGRGATDADANGEFHKLVRLFEQGNHYAFVLPTFVGVTRPLLPQTLDMVARFRPERLLVLPYLLFNGRLIKKIESLVADFTSQYPWIQARCAEPLGVDARLFEVLDQRIAAAHSSKTMALPCVTCEYRTQLPGLSNKVGGLKAMLWSLRHLQTHAQSGPHEFPHKNLKKHILVCGNVDCVERGSMGIISRLRSAIKTFARHGDFRVTRTSCMGRCGEGPVMVVYPDGIWYQGVTEGDTEELVREHLLQDRIVSRLVDNIMQ